jgi:2-polyprenyl-6-methoxyphenol hydroxylase-like FAD-dependent oxidoreductase
MNFPRTLLCQTLLDGLGASKSKIRTGAGIDDIEVTKNGVRVRLSDGSVEEGSIVIGADGVHSRTRAIMQKLAKEAGQDFAKEEDPIVSNYQIMVCIKICPFYPSALVPL